MTVRAARAWFAVQAAAIAAWWIVLWLRPSARALFRPPEAPDATLLAFAPGDVVIAIASAVLARAPAVRWRGALGWTVAGAMVYATAYTVALAASCAAGVFGAILMAPAALASLLAARALHHAHADALPDRRSR